MDYKDVLLLCPTETRHLPTFGGCSISNSKDLLLIFTIFSFHKPSTKKGPRSVTQRVIQRVD